MDSVRTASAAVRSSGTRQCALRRSPSFGALTSSDVRLAARRACAGAISRLLEQGRNFAVEGPDGPLFPAFQFRDGETRAIVAEVRNALGDHLRGWEILARFTGSSGRLDGARPVDLLAAVPDDVVAAAVYQVSLSDD